jgi:hypothetical protein
MADVLVIVVVVDRRMNRRVERLFSGGSVIVIICIYLVYSFRLLRPRMKEDMLDAEDNNMNMLDTLLLIVAFSTSY